MPPGLKTEGRRGQTRPSDGEKMPENNEWNLGVPKSSDGECFLAEKNEKGNATARWASNNTDFDWNQPYEIGWKKNQLILPL